MHTVKSSRFLKLILQMILFVSGGLALIGVFKLNSYAFKYPYEAKSFLETSDFQSKFLKYVERTAVYARYRESGYVPSETSLYDSTDLPSVLTGAASGTLLPSGGVYTASQESFDYYNHLLNECDTNFLYFVKNLNTGAKYCSPYLNTLAGGIDNVESYLNNLKNAPAYLKLNTQSRRFVTNVNRSYDYLNESNINWVINYLQDGLKDSSLISSPSYKDESDNVSIQIVESPAFDGSPTADSGENGDLKFKNTVSEYALYAYVLEDFPFAEDEFFPMYQEFQSLRNDFDLWIYYAPAAIICFVLSLSFAAACAGHNHKTDDICLGGFDRFYTELSIAVIAGIIVGIYAAYEFTNGFYLSLLGRSKIWSYGLLYILIFPFASFGIFSMIRRTKAHSLIRDSLIYRILSRIAGFLRRFVENRSLTFRAALVLTVFCLIQVAGMYCFLRTKNLFFLFVLFLDYLFLAAVAFRLSIDLNVVMDETKKIAEGDINHKIPIGRLAFPSKELGTYVNSIGDGFSCAIEERVKSERLKTELITNVSHDIKTPLTSIINYVDLLNKKPFEDETSRNYLNILTEKSWRLKTLIDDLVEASKASSGTLALHFERINVGELLKQAAGEFEDRFMERGLEIVLNLSDKTLYVMADGRSTYRIIENLFSNVTKYALSGTRVYIDMRQEKDSVLVSVKNISAAKLNITGEELMERFVRGDSSRNTEGSGLGLSIAKSLALLQHGTFELALDGDLFKVLFSLPLCDQPPRNAALAASEDTEPEPIWDDTDETGVQSSLPSGLLTDDANDNADVCRQPEMIAARDIVPADENSGMLPFDHYEVMPEPQDTVSFHNRAERR